MTEQAFFSLIDERKEELYALLTRLIRIDSQDFGSTGLEAAMADELEVIARELGLPADRYSPLEIPGFRELPDYMEGRNLENRPNVTIVLPGTTDEEGVHLMAHSDTVPVGNLADWERDPFSGDVENGCIFGRGACDDKYAIATSLFLFRLLRDAGIKPKRSITFTAYSDEEKGGSHGAMAGVIRYPHRRILNLDCKDFEIWSCAAGGSNIVLHFAMKEPQDSALAVTRLLPTVLEETEKFGERRRREMCANPNYEGTTIGEGAMRYMEVKCANESADLHAGYVWFQYYTDKSTEAIDAEMQEMCDALNARLSPLGAAVTGWERNCRSFRYGAVPKDASTIRELQAAALRATGRRVMPVGACLSDLSVILHYGSPEAISFGIGRDFDAIGGAHQPNEFVECDALVEFTKIVAAYLFDTAIL